MTYKERNYESQYTQVKNVHKILIIQHDHFENEKHCVVTVNRKKVR